LSKKKFFFLNHQFPGGHALHQTPGYFLWKIYCLNKKLDKKKNFFEILAKKCILKNEQKNFFECQKIITKKCIFKNKLTFIFN
jgi:hypothetical protein